MTLANTESQSTSEMPKKTPMSRRARILFFVVAWLIVLMPFLFWRSTWFGHPLSEDQITEYLRDDEKPRNIQHALVQVGERIGRKDAKVSQWYPELVRLAKHPVAEIRSTDAWLMGQVPSRPEFREALRGLLQDESPAVRGNAALALVSFGDDSGREQIVAMLRPASVAAPAAGRVIAIARATEPVRQGTMVAQIDSGNGVREVRSPISGRIHSAGAAAGAQVQEGAELLVVSPGADQVWEALRALYLIGLAEDLEAVRPYTRPMPEYPERIRQQAELAEKAILRRASD